LVLNNVFFNTANTNVTTSRTLTLGGANTDTNTISGSISDNATALGGTVAVTKTDAGTWVLSGNNTFTGTVNVQAGVLRLSSVTGSAAGAATNVIVATSAALLIAQSSQVNNTASVTLSGGTIQRASGVSEVFGNLNVSTASFLDFGSGTAGTLSFGTYTASALLTVNNFFEGNVLTFGTDLSGSISDTNSFKFDNAFTSSWNQGSRTFTITAIPESSTYVAAAGLLGLLGPFHAAARSIAVAAIAGCLGPWARPSAWPRWVKSPNAGARSRCTKRPSARHWHPSFAS